MERFKFLQQDDVNFYIYIFTFAIKVLFKNLNDFFLLQLATLDS